MDTEHTIITNAAGTFRIRVEYDETAESPREWSNVGVLTVVRTRRFVGIAEDDDSERERSVNRSTEHRTSPVALSRYLRMRGATAVVVVRRNHDGDLVQVEDADRTALYDGAIYDTAETRAECGEPADMRAALLAELDVYNTWQRGEFVGRIVEKFIPACEHGHGDEWVEVDSVWGFDDVSAAIEDGRDNVAGYVS